MKGALPSTPVYLYGCALEFFMYTFLNLYADYVYLAPTKEEWFGFPVYRFKQQNAKQVGAEIQFKYSTKIILCRC